MTKLKEFYTELDSQYQLQCVLGLLHWDQQVNLPKNGAQARAQQLELIERMIHEQQIKPSFLDLVDQLAHNVSELNQDDKVNVLEVKRSIDRERKIPTSLVAEKSRVCAESFSIWCEAKPKNDWKACSSHLNRIIELAREEAKCVGYEESPYDAHLDIYEPKGKISWIRPLLTELAQSISQMLPSMLEKQVAQSPALPDLTREQQLALNRKVLEAIGYSFESGRIDVSAHPFMCGIGVGDYRVTTRYDKSSLLGSLYSTLHEGGHALYEMGLPQSLKHTPLGSALSMSVHESQSRLWENLVGRSRGFSKFLARTIKSVSNIEIDAITLWQSVNFVEPSLIRVEADEVTYTQHILIRTLLEEQLITGDLTVEDLPSAWNKLYQQYLGVSAEQLKDGAMQDVHWFQGSFGYFPSYALGNLYGINFFDVLKSEIAEVDLLIENGEFAPIFAWLKQNVHAHGKRFSGQELVKRISGKSLSSQPFVDYLQEKFLKFA